MPEPTPEPVKQYKLLTAEELRKIAAALDTCQGNRRHAAQALGFEEGRVRNAVLNTPWLLAKWGTEYEKKQVPSATAADEIHRPEPVLPPDQLAGAVAVIKEDRELASSGWGKLGYTKKEVSFMQELQTQYASNLKGTMDLAYGGSAHATTRLLMALEKINEKLQDVEEHPEKYRRYAVTNSGHEYEVKGPHEYMLELYDRFIAIADGLRKMNTNLTEANKTRLMMAKMVREQSASMGPKKVAAWSPTEKPSEQVKEAEDVPTTD